MGHRVPEMERSVKALGITRRHLRRVLMFGGILAAVLLVIGFAAGTANDAPWTGHKTAYLLLMSVGLGLTVPAFVAIASVLRLEVSEGIVRNTLFGRWTLAHRPVADLTEIRVGGRIFPVVLHFQDGARMRVIGAPISDIPDFVDSVHAEAPHAGVIG